MVVILLQLLQPWLEGNERILFHPFSLILLSFLSIFFLIKLINGDGSKSTNLPPSPPKLPFLGNLHQVGKLVHRSFRDLSRNYGPLMLLHLGHNPTLVVSSAEMAREIMKNCDTVFTNRPATTAAKMLLYGCTDVGFGSYGESWLKMKKICVQELLSIKRVQAFKFVREEEVTEMIEKIRRSCSLGATINLSEMVTALSNSIISRCVLGRKYDGEYGENRFGELSRELMKLLVGFSFGDFFPSFGWMDTFTGLVSRLKRVSQELDIFFDQVIDEHLTERKHYEPDNQKDFVDLLLHVQKDKSLGIDLTRDNIKAILLDMFFAGSDTSSTVIEWAMAELIKNPNVMKKAQEEVRRVVGKKSKVEEEDIYQMNHLKSVVKETLRLHPPAPTLVPRESTTSTNVKGYHIPAKTTVFINAWAIQRDPQLWDSPEEFIPERFDNTTIDFKGQNFEFIPFGSGRRGCPGISFGTAVIELVISNLLYWFDWELPGGANKKELDMAEAFGLTVSKKIPLHLAPISHFS